MVIGFRGGMWNVLALVVLGFWVCSVSASVSYDGGAIIINGKRRILLSGSIHYPRSTPEMWPDLIQKAKDGGLDVIQTYVFWNVHEPQPGKYNFEGNYDLVRFIKVVRAAGLYVSLRIGPYICAEWNFGGFPVWLKYIPGISFRTANGPFEYYMRNFTTKIVNMMKAERLFEAQGGPIILSQIENEYGPVEYELGAPGRAYTEWAAGMAVGLHTGVPWIMCKQDDAPDPVINTCNGFYCDYFSPNKPYKPSMWTEAWTGWFTQFGGPKPYRPVEDLAFSVAKFIQKGGSFINYYMYHGGTNFGRTAGGPFITTSYDYDAPLDEYGLTRQRKWGHLKDLHKAIKLCEPALVSGNLTVARLGRFQEAHVFRSKSEACAAFLANNDTTSFATVEFGSKNYSLPPWSISILPDCNHTAYNTAEVGWQSTVMKMTPVIGFPWQAYHEKPASHTDSSFTVPALLEQINITRDVSDYLWYITKVKIKENTTFTRDLNITSAGHAVNVFVNGELKGTAYGSADHSQVSLSLNINFTIGVNEISILSVVVDLPNVGLHFETWEVGLLNVTLGRKDLSQHKWSYKVGLKGEAMNLFSPKNTSAVKWGNVPSAAKRKPLMWYKTTINALAGNAPLALDMNSMGKGQVWINGQSIGRYWAAYKAAGNCSECRYNALPKNESLCWSDCGKASQRWYHLPRSWLKPTGNLLVVFEELGGEPNGILLVRREVDTVCANIYARQPTLELSCGPRHNISSIKFASFGNSGSVGLRFNNLILILMIIIKELM